MTARREELSRQARRWVEYAEEDLRLAEHALGLGRACPFRLVAYHAQQCVEKYFKALLVLRDTDFPYTHNISVLLELCGFGPALESVLTPAETLTQFAVTARYPGLIVEISEPMARAAIGVALETRQHIREEFARGAFDPDAADVK